MQCLLSDLEVILKLESSKSKDEGWSLCSQSEFCEVWKKRCEHESTHLVKVQPLCSLANAWNTCRVIWHLLFSRAIYTCLASHQMTVSACGFNIGLASWAWFSFERCKTITKRCFYSPARTIDTIDNAHTTYTSLHAQCRFSGVTTQIRHLIGSPSLHRV